MIKKLFFLLMILATVSSYAQQVHTIRFVHIGSEEKPIGTIVICVEKLVNPTDKPGDDLFGKAIMTNIKTFETIRKYTLSNKYLIPGTSAHLDYRIIINDKQKVYLDFRNAEKYFSELRALLIKEKCDKAVLQVLKNKPW